MYRMDGTDGGPAFPSQWDDKDNEGMTLRDWFAGQALAGLLAQAHKANTAGEFARQSYLCADAMLEARDK